MKNRMGFGGRLLCACLCLIVITAGMPADAKAAVKPRMVDMLITSNMQNVLLYARLVDCFRADMDSAILAGVPAVFTIYVDVYQERPYRWDTKIATKEIRRTIKYDNLKKTFSITTNGNSQPALFTDFQSAQKAMSDMNGIPVVPLSRLTKNHNYYAQVHVKIDKIRLPFYMEYVFVFVSYWDFETPTYKIRFSY
ncbi:MAG: DUF4390 domain-containing protein [Smithella sp.]